MKAVIPHTRRERVANYGDAVNAVGQGRPTAFSLSKEEGTALTITAQVEEFSIPASAVGKADFRPYIHVEWGHGATIARADVDITWRQRVPLVCSTVQVQLFIAALPFPGQTSPVPKVPNDATCKARIFVSEGLDGTRQFPTFWQTQIDVALGVFSDRAARLASLRGFNPAAAAPGQTTSLFLLVFDKATPPIGGDIPMDGMPLPFSTSQFGGLALLPLGETRAFVNGIAWGVSSTPFRFTPSGTPIFAAAEIQQ